MADITAYVENIKKYTATVDEVAEGTEDATTQMRKLL